MTQVTFARTLGSNFLGARGFSKTESPCAEVLAARKGLRLSADSVELDSDHCRSAAMGVEQLAAVPDNSYAEFPWGIMYLNK